MFRFFDSYRHLNHRVFFEHLLEQPPEVFEKYGITQDSIKKFVSKEDNSANLSKAHQEALIHLVKDHGLLPDEAIKEINELSEIQAWTLSELFEVGLRGESLRKWRPSQFNNMTFDLVEIPFNNVHKDALAELILKYHLEPEQALQEIDQLQGSQAYALLDLYEHGLRGAHLKTWQPISKSEQDFSSNYQNILTYFIKKCHLAPQVAINKLNTLSVWQAKALLELHSLSNLPFQGEIECKIESDRAFAKLLNVSIPYLKSYYEKYGTDQLTFPIFRNDVEAFFILCKLKHTYDNFIDKNQGLHHSLQIFLEYLYELADTSESNRNIAKTYHRKDKRQLIYSKFFCDKFDPKIFESRQEYDDYRYAFEGAKALLKINYENDGTINFSFINRSIPLFLLAKKPCSLLEGKTKFIVDFICEFDNQNVIDRAHVFRNMRRS